MTFSSTYCSNWRVSHSYSRTIRSTLLTAFQGIYFKFTAKNQPDE